MLINIDNCEGMDMKLYQLAEENNLTDEQFRYFTKGWQALWGMIIELPSTDRPQGKWIGEADGYADGEFIYDTWYCSNCDYVIDDDKPPAWNFCPNCGADMK